jgi:hypothetical protein
MLSGYPLRDVINLVDRFNFSSSDDIHTLSHLYESMLSEAEQAAFNRSNGVVFEVALELANQL